MAILGVMAVIILVIINPVEKLAQARDSNRLTSVTQLGHALQAYYTSTSSYPVVANWAQNLIDKSEISSFPSGVPYSAYSITPCTTYVEPYTNPTYCYNEDEANGRGAIIFTKAEALSYRSKCTAPYTAYFVFSTVDGRGGTICSNSDPIPWDNGTITYLD